MKTYETTYDFDFYDSNKLQHYTKTALVDFKNINKIKILGYINYLIDALEKDQKENIAGKNDDLINLYFDGNATSFYESEKYDYEYISHFLNDCKNEFSPGHQIISNANYKYLQQLFLRKNCLIDFNYIWYRQKRFNFTSNFLSNILPDFSKYLFSEQFISSNHILKNLNLFCSIDETSNNNFGEYGDNMDCYFMEENYANNIITILENNNKISTEMESEKNNILNQLKKVVEGKVIFILYK